MTAFALVPQQGRLAGAIAIMLCHHLGGEARLPGEPEPAGKLFRNRGLLVTWKSGYLGAVSVL